MLDPAYNIEFFLHSSPVLFLVLPVSPSPWPIRLFNSAWWAASVRLSCPAHCLRNSFAYILSWLITREITARGKPAWPASSFRIIDGLYSIYDVSSRSNCSSHDPKSPHIAHSHNFELLFPLWFATFCISSASDGRPAPRSWSVGLEFEDSAFKLTWSPNIAGFFACIKYAASGCDIVPRTFCECGLCASEVFWPGSTRSSGLRSYGSDGCGFPDLGASWAPSWFVRPGTGLVFDVSTFRLPGSPNWVGLPFPSWCFCFASWVLGLLNVPRTVAECGGILSWKNWKVMIVV